MLEKLFKVTFILTIWSLIFVAVAAILPDSVWEKTPTPLHPLRNFLAQKKIISSDFLKGNRFDDLSIETGEFDDSKDLHCDENGVCTVAWAEEKTNPAGRIPIRKGSESVTATSLDSEIPAFPSLPPLSSSPASPSLPSLPSLPASSTSSSPLLPLTSPSPSLPPLPTISPQQSSGSPSITSMPLEPLPKNPPTVDTPEAGEAFASSQMERGFAGFQAGVDYPVATNLSESSRSSRDSLSGLSFDSIHREDNSALQGSEQMISTTSFPESGIINPVSGATTATPSTPFPSLTPAPNTNSAPIATSIPPLQIASTSLPPGMATNNPTMPLPNTANDLLETIAISQNRTEYRSSFIKLNHLLRQNDDSFNQSERGELNRSLDRLAYSIFYDPNEHVLESPYIVGNGNNETLTTIAMQYKITPELLAAINGISAPGNIPLAPQTKLKVVRGPVTATVSMSKKELTVFFDGLYAGRFRMGYARAAQGLRGIVSVENKIQNPQYHGPLANGQIGDIAGGAIDNPLGPCWIALNNGLGLQGTNHPEFVGNETAPAGGLIFSNKDIVHLNILLPTGATINLKE